MDQYRLDISKFSTLARGTGTKNGVVVGEGIETIGDHLSASYPGIETEKPKTAPLPSTYLTRRGSLMLYSRPDVSPSWEQDLLGCYNNMGSLVDGVESVSSKREEKIKSMDPRCVPGRHFNGYVGVLKNSLFFPRKGRSPGLELLPMHLEDMGVNIGEFLRGKGCYDHLIPPEQMSLFLPHVDITTNQYAYDAEEIQLSTAEGTAQPTAQPTPAPPQSPLPDDTNQNQRVTRIASYSAGRRFVSGSGRRTGSARSVGLTSEADSAYGTKFLPMNRYKWRPNWRGKNGRFHWNKLPPIAVRPNRKSADMSTYRSAVSTPNRLDATFDRPPVDTNVAVTINNSGDRSKDQQMGWVADHCEAITQSSHRDEADAAEEAVDARVRLGDSNKLLARTRVAEWVNAADSGLQPPSTPVSHTDETQVTEEAEDEMGKQTSFFTTGTNESASSFTTEFDVQPEKRFGKKKEKKGTLSAMDSSSLGQVTVTSTFETATLEQSSGSHMKSIDEGVDEKDSSHISVTEDCDTKAFCLSELDETHDAYEVESEDIIDEVTPKLLGVTFQPRHASADLKTSSVSEGRSSQLTTTPSSLLKEANRHNNRNASNVFGADWRTNEESPVTNDQLSESINLPKREGPQIFGDLTPSDSQLKTLRLISSQSGTSGVDTLPPSGMTSVFDTSVPAHPKTPVSLFESVSGPRGDPELPPTRTPAPSAVGASTTPVRPATAAPLPKETKKAARGRVAPRPPKKPKTGAPRAKRAVRAASAGANARAKSAEERAAAAAAAAQERAERQERERAELAAKRAAAAEAARLEKERRLAKAALLQDRIKSADEQRVEQQQEMERRKRETEQRLKALVAEEETMRQMEEEARHQILSNRNEMRAERERRRQAELEKRKEEIRRRREEDEKRQEQATRREREMLARLGDPALQERMEMDEAARRAERERLMMERLAEEERFAEEAAAAEEARLAEFERLAEEEAVARLREDMDEVEDRKRALMREQEELRREEEELSLLMEPCIQRRRSLAQEAVMRRVRARRDLAKPHPSCASVLRAVKLFVRLMQDLTRPPGCFAKWPPRGYRPKTRRQTPLTRLCRMANLADQRRMEEERQQEAERMRQRQEAERQMLLKMPVSPCDLELEEVELQQRLKAETAQLEAEELRRRERNQEVRAHLAGLQLNQHLTRPWVYSYFVHWPRDLFEKPMGGGAAKQKQFRFPPPKSASKNKGSLPPL